MTTTSLRHYQVAPGYRVPMKASAEQIQQAARVWFSRRKLRQHTRQIMHFVRLPNYVTLKYKLR